MLHTNQQLLYSNVSSKTFCRLNIFCKIDIQIVIIYKKNDIFNKYIKKMIFPINLYTWRHYNKLLRKRLTFSYIEISTLSKKYCLILFARIVWSRDRLLLTKESIRWRYTWHNSFFWTMASLNIGWSMLGVGI